MATRSKPRTRLDKLPAAKPEGFDAMPYWVGSPALLEQMPEGVIVADANGAIVFINAAAAELHGLKRLGVVPDQYSETYNLLTLEGAPFPAAELPLTRAVRGETVIDARWRVRRPARRAAAARGRGRRDGDRRALAPPPPRRRRHRRDRLPPPFPRRGRPPPRRDPDPAGRQRPPRRRACPGGERGPLPHYRRRRP